MENKADGFDVTILRPSGKEIPRDVCIGFTQLAHVIAQRIREDERKRAPRALVSMIDLVQRVKED